MTNDELEAVRARQKEATRYPNGMAVGRLIRTDIPALLDEVERKRDFARTQGDILHHTAELREIAEARATRAEAHAERLASVIVRGLAMEQLPPYARDMEGRRTTLRKEARQALSAYRGSEV